MSRASIANRHFLLRRLHSLFGLIPVGAFLVFHLWENSQSRFGPDHYNEQVYGWLQSINYLLVIEIFLIALPLLFHALYGVLIIRTGRPEMVRYPYLHNVTYLLQRISGIGLLLFLLLHVGWTRLWGVWEPEVGRDLYIHMQTLLSHPLNFGLYLIGLMLAVFHLCNGLWSMAISWGVVTTPQAQRRLLKMATFMALILMFIGIQGLWGFLP